MSVSELRLIKNSAEYLPKSEICRIPKLTRGIYVLYKQKPNKQSPKKSCYDVVYVGMAGGEFKSGIRGRLESHKRKKGQYWTHFSAYEVWDNIREQEVRELEGILRHLYRFDSRANVLAVQKAFSRLLHIHKRSAKDKWLLQKK